MTTAQRREEILALLNQADAPIAAKDLAARFGVSRQVIVQDLAVIRASRPNIISTNRGYILQQQETGCLREFKVRHTPEQAEQELNLIVDHGGRVKNISISHRVYGRITAEMDIRSRQDVQEFLQALAGGASTVLSTATDGYHYHLVEAATPDRLDLIGQALQDADFLAEVVQLGRGTALPLADAVNGAAADAVMVDQCISAFPAPLHRFPEFVVYNHGYAFSSAPKLYPISRYRA